MCDLLWSDPDDIQGWGVSPRGAGYVTVALFGLAHFRTSYVVTMSRPAPTAIAQRWTIVATRHHHRHSSLRSDPPRWPLSLGMHPCPPPRYLFGRDVVENFNNLNKITTIVRVSPRTVRAQYHP